MFDISDKTNKHVHAVDKWDFVAFALDGSEAVQVESRWRQRRKKVRRKRDLTMRMGQPLGFFTEKGVRQAKGRKRLCAQNETALKPANIELDASRLGAEPKRVRRILGVCNGIGVSSVCLTRLGVDFHKTVAEIDEDCRRLTKARFPDEVQYGDLRNLLQWPLEKFAEFDLLEGGFPCQDVSSANKQGRGLQGDKSCLFFVILELVRSVRFHGGHFLLECVDFAAKHPRDFELVSALLGVLPVMLCASDVSGGRRPRAFWCFFTILS